MGLTNGFEPKNGCPNTEKRLMVRSELICHVVRFQKNVKYWHRSLFTCTALLPISKIFQTKLLISLFHPVPEFIDPVFTKTSPKRSFSLNRKRAFWLVFAKTGSIIPGTDGEIFHKNVIRTRKQIMITHNIKHH